MNLGGIPGAEHGLGFGIVTVLTLLVCVTLYKKFREDGVVVAPYAVTSRRESAMPATATATAPCRRPT